MRPITRDFQERLRLIVPKTPFGLDEVPCEGDFGLGIVVMSERGYRTRMRGGLSERNDQITFSRNVLHQRQVAEVDRREVRGHIGDAAHGVDHIGCKELGRQAAVRGSGDIAGLEWAYHPCLSYVICNMRIIAA